MKLTYLGREIHPETNVEKLKTNEFGFTAKVTFNRNSGYTDTVFNNLTEVHNNFKNSGSIAFESDLHGTGCTREIRDIKTCDITLATEMAEYY